MKLSNILKNINYLKVLNEQNLIINSVKTDTRKICKSDTFIGIKGETFDGNTFYKDAFKNGANICILDSLEENDNLYSYLKENKKTIIIVEDSIKALGELAKYKRSLFSGNVIAITGSSGKTSTKDMIYSVLSKKYQVTKTEGNLNNHIGLPLTILNADLSDNCWILEMGMNHLNEIHYLSNIASPDIAVISNVGTSHIGNLGSRENILKAKLEIIDGLKENGTLIFNNDNDLLNKWYQTNKNKYKIITIGIESESNYQATNIVLNETTSEFIVEDNKILVNTGGIHFIYNALMGYAIGNIFNMNLNDIKQGIQELNLSKNRMDIIETNGYKIIDDSYNSNYDSCKYSLKFLGNFKERKIAVLGTMLELGEYSSLYHKMLGRDIVNENIDILITVGNYTDLINTEAIKLGFNKNNSYHFENNEDAIDIIKKLKQNKDVILIKASNSMNFKEIVKSLK